MIRHLPVLSAALAERFREVLPRERFSVEADRGLLSVTGGRATMVGPAWVPLLLPLPASVRLRLLFLEEARDLQEFVTEVTGSPWPAPGATPHVRVTADWVHVWYGRGDDDDPVLVLRPFSRRDLRM